MVEPFNYPLQRPANRLLKRVVDICFSIFALVTILWWLHLVFVILIRATSPGRAVFRQIRIGRDGCPFICYKYRTMVYAPDELEKPRIMEDSAHRVTWIGRFLRTSNLDELPQFINVLKGDMSVVGPRPHMLGEDELLPEHIPYYRQRLLVIPGITGWAAINGFRGGSDMAHMRCRVDLDVWYIRNWSLWLDLRIAATTAWRMLTFRAGGQ